MHVLVFSPCLEAEASRSCHVFTMFEPTERTFENISSKRFSVQSKKAVFNFSITASFSSEAVTQGFFSGRFEVLPPPAASPALPAPSLAPAALHRTVQAHKFMEITSNTRLSCRNHSETFKVDCLRDALEIVAFLRLCHRLRMSRKPMKRS